MGLFGLRRSMLHVGNGHAAAPAGGNGNGDGMAALAHNKGDGAPAGSVADGNGRNGDGHKNFPHHPSPRSEAPCKPR